MSITATGPSAGTRAMPPSTSRTAAKSRSGETWIAAGATSSIVSDRPGIGVSSSPARKPKPSSVWTSGGPVTRVERVETGSAVSGVEATDIWAPDAPAVARLAASWVCMRSSVVDSTSSASALKVTCAMPDSSGTDGRASVTLSGNEFTTEAASHPLGDPLTSASGDPRRGVRRREPAHVGHEELPRRVEVHERIAVEHVREDVAIDHHTVRRLGDPPLSVVLLSEAEGELRDPGIAADTRRWSRPSRP